MLDRAASGEDWPKRGLVFATSGGKAYTGFAKGKTQLDNLLARDSAAIEPWRIHDLRRTLATGLQRLGARFEVVESVLNHVSGSKSGVAGVYQRHDWAKEKHQAMAQWSAHLQQLLSPAPVDNVVQIESWKVTRRSSSTSKALKFSPVN